MERKLEKRKLKPKGIAWYKLPIEDRAKVAEAAVRSFVMGHRNNNEIGAIKVVNYPGTSEEVNSPDVKIMIAGGFTVHHRSGKVIEVSDIKRNFPPHISIYIPRSSHSTVDALFGKPVLHVSSGLGMEIAEAVAADLQQRHGLMRKPTIRNWQPRE